MARDYYPGHRDGAARHQSLRDSINLAITPPMLVALGENGIKTVEDLAGCDTDELHGWVEQTSGTTTRHAGVLDGFALSRDECGAIIMKARTRVGWIDESRPAQPAKAR